MQAEGDTSTEYAAVPQAAFFFCRYSIAVLVWVAFFLKAKALLAAVFVILVLSALLTIRRAPLIVLYTQTIHRLFPSREEELRVRSMRFAHTLGAALAFICLLFLYGLSEPIGWGLTLFLCVIKTISALGLCPAYKLHACITGGSCCAFLKKS
jgi:hypothetical protein